MDFKKKLEHAIFDLLIPQAEIARRAGVPRETVSRLWLGKHKPNKKTVLLIERAIAEIEKEKGIK